MRSKLVLIFAILVLFCAGVFGGRAVGAWLQRASMPPAVSHGDHKALLQRANADLLLFSLSTCPHCRNARAWLERHQLPFTELVIDTSPPAQRLFDELKEPALPILITRDRLVRGFEPGAYADATAGIRPATTAIGSDSALGSRR